jgi:hypothetical protein
MRWDEVRQLYPDQWVKLKLINSHKDESYLYDVRLIVCSI